MNICFGRVQRKRPLKVGEVLCLQKYLEASPSFPDSFIIRTTQLPALTHFDKFVVENEHQKNYFPNKRHVTPAGLNLAKWQAYKQ